ncbi:hypothetical protein [Mycoplasmoides genitalium]
MLFKSRDVKVKYESSGSNTNTISFENNANKPSYVVEFTTLPTLASSEAWWKSIS